MSGRRSLLGRRRLRDKLRYMVDRAFTREFMAQLALFLLLITVVTAIGMTAIFFGLFARENEHVEAIPRGIDGGFFDALWWSVNHVLSLPEFERMYGASAAVLVYSFLLSLMGVATFGILISLINNSIRNRVDAGFVLSLANGGLVIEYNDAYPLAPEIRQRGDELVGAISSGAVVPPAS